MSIIANYRERSRANRASTNTKLCGHASHGSERGKFGEIVAIYCLKMSDPCSFSAPSECECTHINWFVNVLFEKQILDCHAELEFEVKKNNVDTLVSMALVFDCALLIMRSFCPQRRKIIIITKLKIIFDVYSRTSRKWKAQTLIAENWETPNVLAVRKLNLCSCKSVSQKKCPGGGWYE